LRAVLERIAVMPGQRGKVVLVTSGETGVGKSAVARSLNAAAVARGMLSVLIEVVAEQSFQRMQGGDDRAADAARALKTDIRSVNMLLDPNQNVAVAAFPGDVRSEFNLIVIDAPSLAAQPNAASISANADFTVLVVSDGPASAGAIGKARAALGKFGHSVTGIVVNQMPRMAARG
jgi:Mrp family chromosome partitioning ATPase